QADVPARQGLLLAERRAAAGGRLPEPLGRRLRRSIRGVLPAGTSEPALSEARPEGGARGDPETTGVAAPERAGAVAATSIVWRAVSPARPAGEGPRSTGPHRAGSRSGGVVPGPVAACDHAPGAGLLERCRRALGAVADRRCLRQAEARPDLLLPGPL